VDENQGSHITVAKKQERVGAALIEGWHKDPDKVLVSVWDLGGGPFTRVEEMNVESGRRSPVTHVPVERADFVVDDQGVVRMAMGAGVDNLSKTYYRDGSGAEWQLINDEGASGHRLEPLGFSADGHTAYLDQEEAKGPDAIYAFDATTHKMRLQLRDPDADPGRILRGPKHEVIGTQYLAGKPRTVFFDENSSVARLYHSLEASFEDQTVVLENFTADGNLALVRTYSDRSPGDYYLFDMVNKKAEHMISHRDWIDPDRMGIERPISFAARDGVVIHGYLTLPQGSNGKNLPLVVNPHGGPFGISDRWGFNGEVQLLASRGYAVLQVNYRGSGGFGRDFQHSGYKQWGGKLVDDVTDATNWAIQQGVADAHRICIYGASYGGYAALMGVAREPSLYRCAIGYVGVYDMQAMYHAGDISDSKFGENFLKDTLGDQNLEAISPDRLAARITVPVMLVAGHEDVRAPPKHTELMRDALQKAGKQVDAKIYDGEGHGFFIEADREDFYTRMLAFLDRNIGASAATTH
jgi:dienelactone hydrolase